MDIYIPMLGRTAEIDRRNALKSSLRSDSEIIIEEAAYWRSVYSRRHCLDSADPEDD